MRNRGSIIKLKKNKIKNYQSSDPDLMIGYGEVGHHKAIVLARQV